MTRICNKCKIEKTIDNFAQRSNEKYRKGAYRGTCKDCHNQKQREWHKHHQINNYFRYKCTKVKAKSKRLGIEFDLTPEYLESIWSGKCPVSGNTLIQGAEKDSKDSAELDRIIPKLGYVQGNVAFLSAKVNRLKNDATVDQLEKLLEWLKKVTK